MYDPKFEKAIQQKMEELEFRPAESVWVNIEKAVAVKRRRRTGYLWRFLLPGMVLVGVTGAYLYHGHAKAPAISVVPAGTVSESVPTTGSSAAGDRRTSAISERPADTRASTTNAAPETSSGSALTAYTGKGHSANGRFKAAMLKSNSAKGGYTMTPENADKTENNAPDAATIVPEGNSSLAPEGKDVDAVSAAGQDRLAEYFYLPGLADQKFSPQIRAANLRAKKSTLVSLTQLSHPKSRWEAGFVAGGGWSKMNRLNADRAKYALASNATSLFAIAGSSQSKHYISNISPGASFNGGIYLQKALSDRWLFNTGMNLHYYSNNITVGQQLTTYVQVSASYVIPTTVSSNQAQAPTMYSAGNTEHFTNKYYFLELPVALQWKVTKSHMLPIFLEGGVSLARLMGASALFYDAKTGLYSKNGDVVDKTQFNVSSSLLIGLPFHGIGIQLGPQIQYGLTPLVNTQGLGDQHLFYTGIRIVVIPGRK